MEAVGTLFLIWSAHAVIGTALAGPVLYLGRKRIGWDNWELLALIIPFCVWVVLLKPVIQHTSRGEVSGQNHYARRDWSRRWSIPLRRWQQGPCLPPLALWDPG
jgi:hypothetical protein